MMDTNLVKLKKSLRRGISIVLCWSLRLLGLVYIYAMIVTSLNYNSPYIWEYPEFRYFTNALILWSLSMIIKKE